MNGQRSILIGIATLTIAATAQAQGNRVACIDVVYVFNEYKLQKDLNTQLRDEQTRLEQEAQQRQQKIEQLEATLRAMDPRDPTYESRISDLTRMRIELRAWGETTQAMITRRLGTWSNQIYKEILRTVETVARERGYDMVVYRDAYEETNDPELVKQRIRLRKVLYFNPSIDISNEVLSRLNKEYDAQANKPKLSIP